MRIASFTADGHSPDPAHRVATQPLGNLPVGRGTRRSKSWAAGLTLAIEEGHTHLSETGKRRGAIGDTVAGSRPRWDHDRLDCSSSCTCGGKDNGSSRTHARAASSGSFVNMSNPAESFNINPAYKPSTDSSIHSKQSRCSSLRVDSSVASSAEAALRIAIDPDTGHSYFVERPSMCDACPFCEDACEVPWCKDCDKRRAILEHTYGVLPYDAHSTTSDDEDCLTTGDFCRRQYANVPGPWERYPRKSSYTLCEIKRRKLTGACWIVSQGYVYDVTAALEDHPGGKSSVLRHAGGQDCTEDFFFHSKAAKREWRQYRIGSVAVCNGDREIEDGARLSLSGDCVIS